MLVLSLSLAATAVFQSSSVPGFNYCDGEPNSSGQPASIVGVGSPIAAENNLTLEVANLPPGQFGLFVVSLESGFVANPGGSLGNLCLGGSIGRDLAGIQPSSAQGTFMRAFDLENLPGASGPFAAQPLTSLHFQLWYRDSVGGAAVSNFSSGYRVDLACSAVEYEPQSFPKSDVDTVTIGDFDQDGDPDVFVVGAVNGTVYLRDPALGFTVGQTIGFPGDPAGAANADLNGDGHLDLVVSTEFGPGPRSGIQVFHGIGNGRFQLVSSYTPPGFEFAGRVVMGDFNGDGSINAFVLAVNQPNSQLVSFNAAGLITGSIDFNAGSRLGDVEVADVDGNGALDLVVAGFRFNPSIAVLLNPFSPQSSYVSLTTDQGTDVAVGDFNGDGALDLVSGGYHMSSGDLAVYLNLGGGLFAPIFQTSGYTDVEAGDFNGDGHLDFVAHARLGNAVTLFAGDGTGSFAAQPPVVRDSPRTQRAFGAVRDIDGDQLDDLVGFTGPFVSREWSVAFGNEGGDLGRVYRSFDATVTSDVFAGNSNVQTAAADFDADGAQDIAWTDTSTVFVAHSDRTRVLPPRVEPILSGSHLAGVIQGDLDGDGDPDLAVRRVPGIGPEILLLRNDAGNFVQAGSIPTIGWAQDLTIEDLDGDGLPELIVGSEDTATGVVSVYRNTGAFGFTLVLSETFIVPVTAVATGDLDGDGFLDVISGSAGLYVNYGMGGLGFSSSTWLAAEDSPADIAVVELVGSPSEPEIAVIPRSIGPEVRLLERDATGAYLLVQSVATDADPRTVKPADILGDGTSELLVASGGGSTVTVLERTPTELLSAAPRNVAPQSQDVQSTDFDGDGVQDLIAFSPATGKISILWGRCR